MAQQMLPTLAKARRMAGLSLIELMVALTIGALLTLGMATLMSNTSRTQNELSKDSRQVENARTAMRLLAGQIKLAGFYGEFGSEMEPPAAFPSPCSQNGAPHQRQAIKLALQAYDGDDPSIIPNCVTNNGWVPGTDVLVLRRTDTYATAPADLQALSLYVQGHPEGWELDKGDCTSCFQAKDKDDVLYPIRGYRSDIYYVGKLADGTPALRRIVFRNGAPDTANIETLVGDIEGLRFDFGIDRSGDGAPNTDENGNQAYINLPATLEEWQDVVTVRVHVLARNPEPTVSYEDDKQYRMGLAGTATSPTNRVVGPFNDSYRRHVYSSTVRVLNTSGRRE